jgi:four helix bundle protein
MRVKAEGSVTELETQSVIAVELGYCTSARVQATLYLIAELRTMLNSLPRKRVK